VLPLVIVCQPWKIIILNKKGCVLIRETAWAEKSLLLMIIALPNASSGVMEQLLYTSPVACHIVPYQAFFLTSQEASGSRCPKALLPQLCLGMNAAASLWQ